MRETFFLSKKRHRFPTIEEAHAFVSKLTGAKHREGSVCHWIWLIEAEIVAEAWPNHRTQQWLVTIKDSAIIAGETP